MFSGFFGRVASLLDQEWTQIFAILTAAMVALNSGLLYAWPSPSIPILISADFPTNITLEQASYTTVIPALASILSSPLYPYLMDTFGRKPALMSVALPQFISWILIATTNNIYVIYVSRFASGFANTCLYATVPVYIGEVASPKVRGLWGNAMSCCVYLGLCLMNIVGTLCDLHTTAYIFSVLPIAFFFLFLWAPESPYYFIQKDNMERGKEQLRKLRRHGNIDKEFEEMCLGIQKEHGSILDVFTIRSNLKGLLIALAVRWAQQFAGISAFATYAQYLFTQAGGDFSATNSAIIYTTALTLASCTSSIFVDKLGRRASLVISCGGCAVILLSESIYFYFNEYFIEHCPYFPIIGMLLYVPLYSIGLGIVPNLMLGELFAPNIKGKALCLLNIAFAVYSSISTKVFQLLSSYYGMYAPFLLFGACCILSTIFSALCVPETSGKTLEQIQVDLKGGKSKEEQYNNTRL